MFDTLAGGMETAPLTSERTGAQMLREKLEP